MQTDQVYDPRTVNLVSFPSFLDPPYSGPDAVGSVQTGNLASAVQHLGVIDTDILDRMVRLFGSLCVRVTA